MSARKKQEVEVKLRVADPVALREQLRRLGARRLKRVREMNTLYDTPRGRFRKLGQLLRLRVMNSGGGACHALLTFKGPSLRLAQKRLAPEQRAAGKAKSRRPPRGQRYKVRDEVEVTVTNPEALRRLLEAVGLLVAFRYEKFRTSYILPRVPGVKLEFDETPIGTFVELEGSTQGIDRAAKLLGYRHADYITRSYRALHLGECRRSGLSTSNMLFPSSRKARKPSRKK